MNRSEFWKNFNLGDELSISGTFIYNGLREFHDMRCLDYTDQIFEVLYNLSVGMERLLKIAVVFVEHDDNLDQEEFERSLYTHSHSNLVERIRAKEPIGIKAQHMSIIGLLESFYSNLRYGRFSMSNVLNLSSEQEALFGLLNRHLGTELKRDDSMFIKTNELRFRRHLTCLVLKIARELYRVICDRSDKLNLYVGELRSDSKASSVFQRDPATLFRLEDLSWRELMIFLMNSGAASGTLDFLRNIEPLDLDAALIPEYLESFGARPPAGSLIDEIDELYDQLEDNGKRLRMVEMIGDPAVDLDGYQVT